MSTGGIGDITSDARGTAARYNDGKPDFALVPLTVMARSFPSGDAQQALFRLGLWQETGERAHLNAALDVLGLHDGWRECARVYGYGARKYAAWNWAKGFQWSVPLACAVRHLLSMIEGETTDPESSEPHRGHVFCNVAMLLTFHSTYREGDDRPRVLVPESLRYNETFPEFETTPAIDAWLGAAP